MQEGNSFQIPTYKSEDDLPISYCMGIGKSIQPLAKSQCNDDPCELSNIIKINATKA